MKTKNKASVSAEAKDKAAVYARYSSHNQGEQSIEGQLAAAQAYAKAKGLTIIHEYVDRAQTGRNDDRDAFQQMLSDCAKHQFATLIVWKFDRFGRNQQEIIFNEYRCNKAGVKVVPVAEEIPDGPEGVILKSVLIGMAEYYSLQLSQNIRRGCRESAKKCRYIGGRVPLGYVLDKDKQFIVDEHKAPVVREIFSRYAAGESVASITEDLNARGIRTADGGLFNKNSLHVLLKNEKYIGVYDFKHGEIRIEGGVPAIVDAETFRRVQEMLIKNKSAPGRRKEATTEYLLTGKIFCGHCGSRMVGESGISHTGATHNYYICIKKKRERACDKKAVRQDLIESAVITHLRDILRDDALIEAIVDRVWDYYLQTEKTNDKRAAIESQLADVDRSISNLVRAVEMGICNEATRKRMEELDAQRSALSAALAEYDLQAEATISREAIALFLRRFRDADLDDRETVKRLIAVFINAVYVYDDHLDLLINCGGDAATVPLEAVEAAEKGAGGFGHGELSSTMDKTYEPTLISATVVCIRIAMPCR